MSYQNAKANMKDGASGVFAFAQRQVDRVIPPDARSRAYSSISAYATERPLLSSFAFLQAVFSFLPVLAFVVFAASTVAFALAAALIFSLFWIGLALLLLVPVVLVASSVAALVWVWAVSSFLIARWLYARAAPTGSLFRGGAGLRVPNGKVAVAVKGENGVRADTMDSH